MHDLRIRPRAGFKGVDTVEPDPRRVRLVRIEIGQRRVIAAGVPFLAVDRAGLSADADVQINDQPELGW